MGGISLTLAAWLVVQLLVNLIAEILGSYWLALIFQASHVVSEVSQV